MGNGVVKEKRQCVAALLVALVIILVLTVLVPTPTCHLQQKNARTGWLADPDRLPDFHGAVTICLPDRSGYPSANRLL